MLCFLGENLNTYIFSTKDEYNLYVQGQGTSHPMKGIPCFILETDKTFIWFTIKILTQFGCGWIYLSSGRMKDMFTQYVISK